MRNAHDDHSYQFASTFQDVDFARIVREATEGTAFILVEASDRVSHRPTAWCLLAHMGAISTVSSKWQPIINNTDVFPYKAISGQGKTPGGVHKCMEKVKQVSNPRETITKVTTYGNIND